VATTLKHFLRYCVSFGRHTRPYFFPYTTLFRNLTGYGFAGFGQIDYQLSSSLNLIAGLRYDHEYKKQQIEGAFLPDGGEAVITRTDTSTSEVYRNLSPKITLSYRLSKDHNFYGMYSKGFRAGGISQLSSDPSTPPLVPYDSRSEERRVGKECRRRCASNTRIN